MTAPQIAIRDLRSIDELIQLKAVEKAVWAMDEEDAIPLTLAIALKAAGNIFVGAFDQAKALNLQARNQQAANQKPGDQKTGSGAGERDKQEKDRQEKTSRKRKSWWASPLDSWDASMGRRLSIRTCWRCSMDTGIWIWGRS